MRKDLPWGVNLCGYFRSEKGTGEAVRAIERILIAGGIPFAPIVISDNTAKNSEDSTHPDAPVIIPGDKLVIGGVANSKPTHSVTNSKITNFTKEINPYRVNYLVVNADQIGVLAETCGRAFFKDRYTIGCWNWELSKFPSRWSSAFDYFDELWVPSTFIQKTLQPLTTIPVRCLPYSIDIDDIRDKQDKSFLRKKFGLPQSGFIFYFAFDYLSILERKNPQGLIRAFSRAFSNQTDVYLLLKTSHAEQLPSEHRKLISLAGERSNIIWIDEVYSRSDSLALMQAVDSIVSLHRSEGFGFLLAEGMAMGKPILTTTYSAPGDWLTEENCFPIGYRLIELAQDYGPYEKGGMWAEPEEEQVVAQLRMAVENRTQTQKIGARGRKDIREKLAPEQLAKQVIPLLEQLRTRSPNGKAGKILKKRALAQRKSVGFYLKKYAKKVIKRLLKPVIRSVYDWEKFKKWLGFGGKVNQ